MPKRRKNFELLENLIAVVIGIMPKSIKGISESPQDSDDQFLYEKFKQEKKSIENNLKEEKTFFVEKVEEVDSIIDNIEKEIIKISDRVVNRNNNIGEWDEEIALPYLIEKYNLFQQKKYQLISIIESSDKHLDKILEGNEHFKNTKEHSFGKEFKVIKQNSTIESKDSVLFDRTTIETSLSEMPTEKIKEIQKQLVDKIDRVKKSIKTKNDNISRQEKLINSQEQEAKPLNENKFSRELSQLNWMREVIKEISIPLLKYECKKFNKINYNSNLKIRKINNELQKRNEKVVSVDSTDLKQSKTGTKRSNEIQL